MADDFDAYHKWLAILPKDQPPHDYRLLGLELFESDPQVIESAADRQMTHVRKYQSGPQAAAARKLLNEIATARLRLLDPKKRPAYDAELRAKLAAAQPALQRPPEFNEFADLPEASSRGGPRHPTPLWRNPSVLMSAAAIVTIVGCGVLAFRFGIVGGSQPIVQNSKTPPLPKLTAPTAEAAVNEKSVNGSEQQKKRDVSPKPVAPQPQAVAAESNASEGPRTPPSESLPTNSAAVSAQPAAAIAPMPLEKPLDLITLVDVKRDSVVGEWSKDKDGLHSPEGHWTRLQIPFSPPEEYVLTVEVEGKKKDTLHIGVIVGGSQTMVTLDAYDGLWSGVHMVDGKVFTENETTRRLGCLEPNQSNVVVCTVRKRTLKVVCNGRTIIDWEGDPKRLSHEAPFAVPDKTRLFLGGNTAYHFRRVEIAPAPPASAGAPIQLTGTAPPIDLLKEIKLSRDAVRGEWKFDREGLVSPTSPTAVVMLPGKAPAEYVLKAVAVQKMGNNGFTLGLRVGEARTMFALNGWGGTVSGLSSLNGADPPGNETFRRDIGTFQDGLPHTVICTVRKNSIVATFDGKLLCDWTGDPERLSVGWQEVPPGNQLFVGTNATSYRIQELTLEPLVNERRTVPDQVAQDKALKRIKELFKEDYASGTKPSRRQALAKSLLSQAAESEDDPAMKYVLLKESTEHAAEAGDLVVAFQALDELAAAFDTDTLPLREKALKDAGRFVRTLEEVKAFLPHYLDLIDAAIERDDYDVASRVSGAMLQVPTKLKLAIVREQLQARSKLLQEQRSAYQEARAARNLLAMQAENPDANRNWGRYLCFTKADWKQGLEFLSKGGEGKLPALARRDLANPSDINEQTALGDEWWAVAEGEKGAARQAIEDRACVWYYAALEQASNLQKPDLDRKIARIFGNTKVWESNSKQKFVAIGGVDANVGAESTLEFWVKTKVADGYLISKRQLEPENSLIILLRGGCPVIMGNGSFYLTESASKVRINDGRWHHIAASKLNLDAELFVDGKPEAAIRTLEKFKSTTPWTLGYHLPPDPIDAAFCRVRISSVPRYFVPFTPERHYAADRATLFMPQ